MRLKDAAAKAAHVPARVILVPPESWAGSWAQRPQKPIAVGLRGISDGEETTARIEAEKFARGLGHESVANLIDAENDALMRWIVARGICDPNDTREPHPAIKFAEDQIRDYMTSAAVRWLFEELEKLQVETSPLHREASDEEIGELIGILSIGESMAEAGPQLRRCARRFLAFALDCLKPPESDDPTI